MSDPLERAVRRDPGLRSELQAPEDAAPGAVELPGYALYYVCEDVKGTCLCRCQDRSLQIAVLEQPR